MASERARADVQAERRLWTEKRQPRMQNQPHRLVFVDETSVNTKMVRLYGRAPRGERLHADAPFCHWGTQTFIEDTVGRHEWCSSAATGDAPLSNNGNGRHEKPRGGACWTIEEHGTCLHVDLDDPRVDLIGLRPVVTRERRS